jgi:hypothetical protein
MYPGKAWRNHHRMAGGPVSMDGFEGDFTDGLKEPKRPIRFCAHGIIIYGYLNIWNFIAAIR